MVDYLALAQSATRTPLWERNEQLEPNAGNFLQKGQKDQEALATRIKDLTRIALIEFHSRLATHIEATWESHEEWCEETEYMKDMIAEVCEHLNGEKVDFYAREAVTMWLALKTEMLTMTQYRANLKELWGILQEMNDEKRTNPGKTEPETEGFQQVNRKRIEIYRLKRLTL